MNCTVSVPAGGRRSGWVRVTRTRPCPVCKKVTWCVISADGSAVICPRTESPRRVGGAGWLHRMTGDRPLGHGPTVRRIRLNAPTPDLTEFALRCHRSCDPGRLAGLARSLCLSVEALVAFGAGWSGDHLGWTFPMGDPGSGRVLGVRLRKPDGRKLSVRGGREALFMPRPFDLPPGGRLFVAEGPTDAAALWDLGLSGVVGRPSCTGGVRFLTALARRFRPAEAVVVSDADAPGRAGAARLAAELSLFVRTVRVVTPPGGIKDARAWKVVGATAADVEDAIRRAEPRDSDFVRDELASHDQSIRRLESEFRGQLVDGLARWFDAGVWLDRLVAPAGGEFVPGARPQRTEAPSAEGRRVLEAVVPFWGELGVSTPGQDRVALRSLGGVVEELARRAAAEWGVREEWLVGFAPEDRTVRLSCRDELARRVCLEGSFAALPVFRSIASSADTTLNAKAAANFLGRIYPGFWNRASYKKPPKWFSDAARRGYKGVTLARTKAPEGDVYTHHALVWYVEWLRAWGQDWVPSPRTAGAEDRGERVATDDRPPAE